jgi:phosphatidylglycerol---prolipoprotein diacylglyceryl transferase
MISYNIMQSGFIHWNIDPEIVNIMGLSIRYYGSLFAGGIILCVLVLRGIFKKEHLPSNQLDTLTTYGVIGIFIGARLGHCLFYEPAYYFSHPLEIILPVTLSADGEMNFIGYQGLASHGGTLGLIIALFLYSRKTKHALIDTVDLLAVVAALGGAFIRLGNFMNSEILGMPTGKPWGIVFERIDDLPRHPAQLYEAISYLIIFALMAWLYKNKRDKLKNGFFFGLVLTLIFTARFIIEFVKENQVGFEDAMIFNMGQLLSLPYIAVGITFMIIGLWKTKKKEEESKLVTTVE